MHDLDVILAAHGAGDGSTSNARVAEYATALQGSLVGARVTAAFNVGVPTHLEALKSATRTNRLVVPLLTSEGYFAERLRQQAERMARVDGETKVLPAIGQHWLVGDAIIARVQRLIRDEQLDSKRCTVVVIGHGTLRHASSGIATRTIADRLESDAGLSAQVAYLDAHPSVEDVVAGVLSHHHVIVVPFLLGGGDHADHDVPARVAAGDRRRGGVRARTTSIEPLVGLPEMEQVLEHIVRQARKGRLLLTVGARRSLLSRRQVELFAQRLSAWGVDVRFAPIDTVGDRDITSPITALGDDDCFTGDITDALLRGEIDVAVHSAKDLPLAETPGIVTAVVLPRASAAEALVSREGRTLAELAPMSRVGTSCARRSRQLARLRPDIEITPIRGVVPDRIAAVDRGEFDAVVLAVAGLERLQLTNRIAQEFSLAEFHPAPAQGAIVAQCRADSPHRTLLEAANDRQSAAAIRAELAFAQRVKPTSRLIPAAYASSRERGTVLRARVIDARTNRVWDTSVFGSEPERLGADAARWLLQVSEEAGRQAAVS